MVPCLSRLASLTLPHPLHRILAVIAGLGLLTGCAGVGALPAGATPASTWLSPPAATVALPVPTVSPTPSLAGVQVWFTDPLSGRQTGGPEQALLQAVAAARETIDMAIYNFTFDGLGDALIQASQRGVRVRLVMESEAMDKALPRRLQAAGIPVVGDQREGLMHNKFTVIDGQDVWTGSLNYTTASAYQDFNNLVRIHSTQAAQDYQAEFDQMFVNHRFGPDKQPVAPYPQINAGGVPVAIYFSPADGPAAHVLAELEQARQSIDFLAYSFTSDAISRAISERAKAGVAVRGVFDASQATTNTGGEYPRLKRAGLDVRRSAITGLMHDKVMIIDGQVVITGSYNFTASAENTNDENLVILRDAAIAGQYLRHFEEVYAHSKK